MTAHLENRIDDYYMYYAPHDPPGGICLAAAPSPIGPWTEYDANPIITKSDPPHYELAHVSSPHTLWIEEEQQFFCFYHGDNDVTRFSSSRDGVNWTYEDVSITVDDMPPSESISYNRVYRHEHGSGNYIQIIVQYHPTRQGIYIARSNDARCWKIDETPLLTPDAVEDATYVWSPCLVEWQGQHYLIYHTDFHINNEISRETLCTDLYASPVNIELTECGPAEKLIDFKDWNPGLDVARVADPFVLNEDGTLYLYASIGKALNQKIVTAKGN
jgi:sucrose-6-phosphate hydrolase SacC (GH32 family)